MQFLNIYVSLGAIVLGYQRILVPLSVNGASPFSAVAAGISNVLLFF